MSNIKNKNFLSDKEKMTKILQFLQINIAEFAKELAVSADELYNLNSGRKINFSQDLRTRILEKYEIINPEWLITGKGDMLRPEAAPPKPPDRPPEGEKTAIGQTQGDTAGEIGQLKRTIAQLSDYNDLLKADNDRLKEELKREREKVASLSEQMNTEPTLL